MKPCAVCGFDSGDLHPINKKLGRGRNRSPERRHRWVQVCLPCVDELLGQAGDRDRVRGYSVRGLRRTAAEASA